MIDIALTLDKLVPGGNWQGSVTSNTKEDFDNVRWADDRPKPTWKEVQIKWAEIEPLLGLEESYEVKIQAKIRELAITDLKDKGELPTDFEDKKIRVKA